MRSLLRIAFSGLFLTAAGWAQPTIAGVVNSASFAKAPQDSNGNPIGNNNIAQGSIFTIFGSKLGPNLLILGPSTLPIPLSLPEQNGTTVAVTSGGKTLSAFPTSNGFGNQISAILPSSTPLGPATITVTYNGQTSGASKVNVVKAAPGIYTLNSQGNGQAIAQVADTGSQLNRFTNAVQPGQTLVLYGTGLGPISGPDDAPPGATPLQNVTVNLAGTVIQPTYAGRVPQFPGEDQISFVVPANAAKSCYVPLEVTSSGQPSNLIYVSVGSGTTCTHPLGLNAAALAKLDSGGTVNVGVFQLLRAVVSGVPAEGAGGLFDQVNSDGAFQLFNRIPNAFGSVNFPVASGSCAVLDTLDTGSGFSVPDFSTLGGKELKAGASINVSGTNGMSQGVLASDTGGYLGVFFSTLGPGTWTVAGTGGPDVGPFTAKTDLPQNLVWTNAGNLASPPRSGITITWTGGNTNANSLVTIFGSNVVINPTDPSKSRGKQFYCNAPASAGQFMVPGTVLSQLPSSMVDASAGEVAVGNLGINTGGSSGFSAPLTAGGSIDAGFLSYGEAHTIAVKYQ